MGIWDITFKQLMRLRPQDLIGLLPGVPSGAKLRLADKEFPPPAAPKLLDACIELESDGSGTLYHLEFEAEPRRDAPLRVFEHFSLAHCGLGGRPVRPVVFYLSPGARGQRGLVRPDVVADGRLVCRFDFEAVRIWELDAGMLLRRPAPALWALVGLCRGAALAHVARARAQVELEVPDEGMRRELLAVLYFMSGTRFDARQLKELFPEEVLMQSSTYDEILRKGEERGRADGLRLACRRVAAVKLGRLPAELGARLDRVADAALLEAVLVDLSAAADAAEARAALERLG
ncbi:MAG TPA: hypothetical protein VGQ83_24210 [Polyangia bacterium]|jgi:hypothetical protein